MNLAQYAPLALRTEKPLPTVQARLEHALLGLITEPGEIATCVKRIVIYEKSLDSLEKDGRTIRTHISEEIGDALWYLAIAADATYPPLFEEFETPNALPGEVSLKNCVFAFGSLVGNLVDVVMEDEPEYGNVPPLVASALAACWALSEVIEIPLSVVCSNNIAKLRERFPDAYSNEAAEARADKGGLDARNS